MYAEPERVHLLDQLRFVQLHCLTHIRGDSGSGNSCKTKQTNVLFNCGWTFVVSVSQMMWWTCCRGQCHCCCVHEWTRRWQFSCSHSCFTSSISGCSTGWLHTTPLCVHGWWASGWYIDSSALTCGPRNKDWSLQQSATWHAFCRFVTVSLLVLICLVVNNSLIYMEHCQAL